MVAVKMISKQRMEESDLEVQNNEIELLKVCDHVNVVKLLDFYEDPTHIYLILEFFHGSNLLKYVVKRDFIPEP